MSTATAPATVNDLASSAEQEIATAWHAYRETEKYGLEFGRVCCEWRDKFKQKKTGPQSKGTGLIQLWTKLFIPKSTAYWWMDRYETSIGVKESEESNDPEIIEGCDMTNDGLVPVTLKRANDFVDKYHRHSERTAWNGGRFAIGLAYDQKLVGVAIVGNPLSATYMDGRTAEVTRVCLSPDAPRNANSILYGACRRTWREMGGYRLITYTLQTESGSSLRGAGWKQTAEVSGNANKWDKNDGRKRKQQAVYGLPKYRWETTYTAPLGERSFIDRAPGDPSRGDKAEKREEVK